MKTEVQTPDRVYERRQRTFHTLVDAYKCISMFSVNEKGGDQVKSAVNQYNLGTRSPESTCLQLSANVLLSSWPPTTSVKFRTFYQCPHGAGTLHTPSQASQGSASAPIYGPRPLSNSTRTGGSRFGVSTMHLSIPTHRAHKIQPKSIAVILSCIHTLPKQFINFQTKSYEVKVSN